MAGEQKPAAPSGLSLYAHLLPGAGNATITSAPVMYNQKKDEKEEAAKPVTDFKKEIFRQQKRPQPNKSHKSLKAANWPSSTPSNTASSSSPEKHGAPFASMQPFSTTTAADWMSREEDDNAYLEEVENQKRYRHPKKKKKKQQEVIVEIDWNQLYDPHGYTDYDKYMDSDERRDDEQEWFDTLHAHRFAAQRKASSSSVEATTPSVPTQGFNMYAPPLVYNEPKKSSEDVLDIMEEDDDYRPSFAAAAQNTPSIDTMSKPPAAPSTVISRAPVRFAAAESTDQQGDTLMTSDNVPFDVEPMDAPRSSRPGQKDFAKRLLMKQGWKEGEGLGATGSGMIKPLYVKLDKPKKFSDAQGGGFRKGGTGKIIAGKKGKGEVEDDGPHGKMSEVIVLLGLLNGVNVQAEKQADSPLYQRIGDECNEKYGNVAKVNVNEETGRVFVKFTQALSALRAVQALNNGVLRALDVLNAAGSVATARFYDLEAFDNEVLDAEVNVSLPRR